MKSKFLIFLIFLLVIVILDIGAEKVAVFPRINDPGSIKIGNGCIYIQDRTTIFIYSLENFAYLGKFGKEGAGPGEIRINPFGAPLVVTPWNNRVYISSMAKLSIFSGSGEYQTEYALNGLDTYFPFGENFLCLSTAPEENNSRKIALAFYLSDKNLKKSKLLYKTDFGINQDSKISLPMTPFEPAINENKLYIVAGIEGFAIDVFNDRGEKLYRIKRNYQRIEIPSSYKQKTLEWFREDPRFKYLYEMFRQRIRIKKYYPPIYLINVDGERIYVSTNKLEKGRRECIILDLQGREITTVFLPIPEPYGLDFNVHYTFKNKYFYKLVENTVEETWELHRIGVL